MPEAPRAAALVPAAGGGARLGRGPKATLRLAGATLVEHVLRRLAGQVDVTWVALPAEGRPAGTALEGPPGVSGEGVHFLAGADTRQATVAVLLAACRATWVLVHDVARPLAPPDLHAAVLAAARHDGAATAALPVADTLHDLDSDRPVPRDRLRSIQTPQAFRTDWLRDAHARAAREGWQATDDAGLVRACGRSVTLVEGSPFAHKLTGAADLDLLGRLAEGDRAV